GHAGRQAVTRVDHSPRGYVRQVLADGRVRSANWVITEAGKLIPPGIAAREAQRERVSKAARDGRSVPLGDMDRSIARGRRMAITGALRSMWAEKMLTVVPEPKPGHTVNWTGPDAVYVQLLVPADTTPTWSVAELATVLDMYPSTIRKHADDEGAPPLLPGRLGARGRPGDVHRWAT